MGKIKKIFPGGVKVADILENILYFYFFQSPKPEQSVMQALESLNEQQVSVVNTSKIHKI